VLAVPVFNQRKEVTHTLVAAGVAEQLDNARCLAMAKDMLGEAAALSARLLSKA
jgi:DNA-binding IclR family transcriptional regulator